MRKNKTDTVNASIEIMQNAMGDILPPKHVHVPEAAMPFWLSITRARATDRWTDSDLELAAELARSKLKVEQLNKEIEVEGDIVHNDRGTQIPNPKHNLLNTVATRVKWLSVQLQVHAEATQGKSRDQVKANKAQQSARSTAKSISDDDLISKPVH